MYLGNITRVVTELSKVGTVVSAVHPDKSIPVNVGGNPVNTVKPAGNELIKVFPLLSPKSTEVHVAGIVG